MSIQYCDNYPENAPDNIVELIEKFEETSDQKDRHKFFTESELLSLLKVCRAAEYQKQREIDNATEWGMVGFSLVSDDRAPIQAMLEAKKDSSPYREKLAKKIAKVADDVMEDVMELVTNKIGPPVMSEKEAWQKYQDYCQEQIKKCEPDSKEYRYYMGEVAKCLEEINR